jgi:hypothetical protein
MEQSLSAAYGDESIQIVGVEKPQYLLCACVIHENETKVRTSLDGIVLSANEKLHWYDMNKAERRRSITMIGTTVELCSGFIVQCAFGKISKQERARRKCLWRLFQILEENGVQQLILENRDIRQDRRDEQLFFAAKRANVIQNIEITHRSGAADSRLWIPDQILGAYRDVCQGSDEYRDFINRYVIVEKV